MRDRLREDYEKAKRGSSNPVEDDRVHDQAEKDQQAIRKGRHTELASDAGVREQSKSNKGY